MFNFLSDPTPSFLSILLTVGAIFLNDASWAYYVDKVKDGKVIAAGAGATSIWLTGAIVTVTYLQNHWLIIVAGISTFIGTAASVKFINRGKSR